MKWIFLISIFLGLSCWLQAQDLTLTVYGNCGMCQSRIEKAALQVQGVQAAEWSADQQELTVQVDTSAFDLMSLHYHLAGVGHDTDQAKAADEVYENLPGCCLYREETDRQEEPIDFQGSIQTLTVYGNCGMCQSRIEKAALQVQGVQAAEWSADQQELTVQVDTSAFDLMSLHYHLAGVGHDTDKALATDEVYEDLHHCCKYREPLKEEEEEEEPTEEEQTVQGLIMIKEGKTVSPAIGANVRWLGSQTGTVTNENGAFLLPEQAGDGQLIVSYVGFSSDTISMKDKYYVEVSLEAGVNLQEVEVVYRRKTTEFSLIEPRKVQYINEEELFKAACCNLSESFETNPSVDVSFTDAVTGTRQIEMLGLAGPYVQIGRENMPNIRGLSALYGFTFVPGTWIEGIQLNMGTGSVVNGFESMTGQINLELKKPQNMEQLYINLYGNQMGRMEANLLMRQQVNEQLSTATLLHGKLQRQRIDNNGDDFLDMPLNESLIAMNRWKFYTDGPWEGQFGVKGTLINNLSGQERFEPGESDGLWGSEVRTRRLEGWYKMGRIFEEKPGRSIGIQLAGSYHEQEAYFGNRGYDANHSSLYGNFIFQDILGTTDHQLKTGLSVQWDQYDETVAGQTFTRNEWVPGAFAEYTWKAGEKLTAVAGLRGDYHNTFGFFATPRLHLRFAPDEQTAIRASVGRGQRTASIFAENIGLFASSRSIVLLNDPNADTPYGLDAEVAWNFGLNLTRKWMLAQRELVANVDFFHTRFDNQIVVDYDATPREVRFYNLQGASYSNSLQLQVDYELIERLNLRLAYRLNDVQVDYQEGRLQKALVARHRAFINLGYETVDEWAFDFTLSWHGQQRLPGTEQNPEALQLEAFSPDFFLANAQINKRWAEDRWEIYLGSENLFGFRQENPILDAENPFGNFFDSSMVWGPIFGRNVYIGMRYRLFSE